MGDVEADQENPSESAGRAWRLMVQHFGIIATVIPLLVAAIRLISVTNYDTAKMLTLLQYSDLVRLVVATVLPTLPMVLVVTVMVAEGWVWSHGQEARNRGVLGFVSAALVWIGMMSAILVPLFNLAILIGLVLVLYLSEKWFHRRETQKGVGFRKWDPWLQVAIPLATALVFPVVYSSNMWLSSEIIALAGQDPMVGYVVGTDEDFTVLFREEDRTVTFVLSRDIQGRKVCNLKKQSHSRPLAAWLADSGDDERSVRCPKPPRANELEKPKN